MENIKNKLVNKITFEATTDELQKLLVFINDSLREREDLIISPKLYEIFLDLNSTFIYLKDYETMEEYALLQEQYGDLEKEYDKLLDENKDLLNEIEKDE